MTLHWLLVVLTASVAIVSATPGCTVAISQSGLNEVHDIVMPIVNQQLNNIKIPDIQQEEDTPIGKITLTVSSIALTGVQLQSAITVAPGVGFTVAISDLQAAVHADWAYRKNHWPHVKDHGSADVSVGQTSISVTVAVGLANSKPTVSVTASACNIGSFGVKLHGGASWLYNIFLKIFKNSIKHSIEKAIQEAVVKAINEQAENFLQNKFQVIRPLNHQVEIDFEFTDPSVFGSNFALFNIKCEILSINNPSEYPVAPPAINPPAPSKMLQIAVSEYTFGSAGYAYLQAGKLHYIVSQKNIPPAFPLGLNTSDWEYIIPGLYKTYPNSAMQISLAVTAAPVVSISSSGVDLLAVGELDIQVLPSPNAPINALAFSIKTENIIKVVVNASSVIVPSISAVSFSLALTNSTVGPVIGIDEIEQMFSWTFENVAVPLINTVISNGFPLPITGGTRLVNPTVSFQNNYVLIETDFAPATATN
jgi:lipopolysaccharide-binding protein